jgi:hypothetical protein
MERTRRKGWQGEGRRRESGRGGKGKVEGKGGKGKGKGRLGKGRELKNGKKKDLIGMKERGEEMQGREGEGRKRKKREREREGRN